LQLGKNLADESAGNRETLSVDNTEMDSQPTDQHLSVSSLHPLIQSASQVPAEDPQEEAILRFHTYGRTFHYSSTGEPWR